MTTEKLLTHPLALIAFAIFGLIGILNFAAATLQNLLLTGLLLNLFGVGALLVLDSPAGVALLIGSMGVVGTTSIKILRHKPTRHITPSHPTTSMRLATSIDADPLALEIDRAFRSRASVVLDLDESAGHEDAACARVDQVTTPSAAAHRSRRA